MHQPQSSTFQQVKHVSRQCSTFEGKYYLASYVVAENGVGLWGCWGGKEKKEESRTGEGPRRKWGKVCLGEVFQVVEEVCLDSFVLLKTAHVGVSGQEACTCVYVRSMFVFVCVFVCAFVCKRRFTCNKMPQITSQKTAVRRWLS